MSTVLPLTVRRQLAILEANDSNVEILIKHNLKGYLMLLCLYLQFMLPHKIKIKVVQYFSRLSDKVNSEYIKQYGKPKDTRPAVIDADNHRKKFINSIYSGMTVAMRLGNQRRDDILDMEMRDFLYLVSSALNLEASMQGNKVEEIEYYPINKANRRGMTINELREAQKEYNKQKGSVNG